MAASDATTRHTCSMAVALAGFRHRAAGGRVGGDEPIHRLRRFADQIAAGTAVLPAHAAGDGRWSTQLASIFVKCLHSLHLYSGAFEKPARRSGGALINGSGHQPVPVYVHPFVTSRRALTSSSIVSPA
jgi:hypothetical protein